jgi:16S rRNA U1498 N3-methylase RsmE
MRPVVSLLSRSTLASIRQALTDTGQARCDLVQLRVDVDEWRKLARQAARDLGRTVQTIIDNDQVVAVLRDWPQNDAERAVTLARMRHTIETMQGRPTPHN